MLTTERDFGNWFAFSHAGWSAYRECPRKWWLSKVLFWRGWEAKAAPDRKLAYQLTKMSSVAAHAGNALHEIFADQVKRAPERTLDQALARFDYLMERGWNQSVNGAWRKDPTRSVCLREHYYGSPYAGERFGKAQQQGRQSIRNFFKLPLLRRILSSRIVAVEDLEQFEVDGVPVWVKIDVDFEGREDTRVLVDWKGGKEQSSHRAQAAIYGLSRVARGVPLDKLWIVLAYVAEPRVEMFQLQEADLEAARVLIREGAAEIRSHLNPPGEKNSGPRKNFPRTTDERTCRMCDMFHACKDSRVVPGVTKRA